jgi:TatD DNase family protein
VAEPAELTEWVEPQEWKQVPDPVPLPSPVIDNHTHLDATGCRTAEDVAVAMDRARAVGVIGAITVADDLTSARWAAAAATWHPDLWAAIGLHPTRADTLDDATRTELAALAAGPRVVAVGETGLDHYWDAAPHDAQREAFAWHIALAKELDLPLMIHDRNAHDAVFDVLAAEGAPDAVVFHCFSGDAAMARICADRGYLMSFAGPLSFRNARDLQAAVKVAPVDLLMVETDAPFLAPHPHRGRKNGPYALPYTLRAMAQWRETDIGELADTVTATTQRFYTLGDLRRSTAV